MRSAFACVFFVLIIHKGSQAAGDDFRPTPIPLSEWHEDSREGRAGTLHETFKTESPPTVAAIPAHYWEDALRHSVYLTLVRDKIDQLIAKGDVISPNTKPDKHVSKEVDDHDLWEKIKTAPFDRIAEEDPSSFGDIAIMATGKLLEENDGFRFTEDDKSKEKCIEDKCMEGVKAIWSVKRIRQRDHETSPGRYHYELTFSVISQIPKKQKKPYENPIRTFTVRESTPDRITDTPLDYKKQEKLHTQVARPERAVWIHKNIVPTKYHLGRSYYHGLDRIFSSLFSYDDEDETPPESTPRHKANSYVPQAYSPYSKAGYVGAPTDQQQNVKYTPYPYKQPVKHSRPIPPPPLAPTAHHYLDTDLGEIPSGNSYNNNNQYSSNSQYNPNQYPNSNQYTNGNYYNSGNHYSPNNFYNNGNPHTLQSEHKYLTSNKPVRSTRPAVLPTPLPPVQPTKELSFDAGNVMRFANETTHIPETITIYKNYNKFRGPPGKVNYFSDHVRPPIYNAPPGVFVTMDKKPFKPMPPLKLTPSPKPFKHRRPIDFRPSPQIPGPGQSIEEDSFVETAFRPITSVYSDSNNTDTGDVTEVLKKGGNKQRKTNGNRKPSKKPDNVKSQKLSTSAPDIITAAGVTEEDIDDMEWANILGAFTKTTPIASPTEKQVIETTTPTSTTATISSTISNAKRRTTTTTEVVQKLAASTTSSSTTAKPRKRTRPPPKFAKQDKIKKHKRITTTTSTTVAPEKATINRPTKDLTPQASSAAISSTKSLVETTSNKTPTPDTTTPSTTPTTSVTTTSTTTSTTQRPSTTKKTTTTTRASPAVTEPKNKNRFRQSTLMLKGTSVKHDKWSSNRNQTSTAGSGKYPYRRKGSNFQGYLNPPISNASDKETRKRYHADRVSTFSTSSTTEKTTQSITTEQKTDENDSYKDTIVDQDEYDESEEEKIVENTEEESKDNNEFIFQSTSPQPSINNNEVNESEESVTSDQIVETSPHSVPKNKTKCKKKKNNEENAESLDKLIPVTTTSSTTTEKPTTNIFQDLFDFNFGGTLDKENEISSQKPELDEEESENHEKYLKINDDFKDFINNLGEMQSTSESNSDDENYDEDDDDKESPSIDDEDSEATNDDETNSDRHSSDDNFEDYKDGRYSLLELLAME